MTEDRQVKLADIIRDIQHMKQIESITQIQKKSVTMIIDLMLSYISRQDADTKKITFILKEKGCTSTSKESINLMFDFKDKDLVYEVISYFKGEGFRVKYRKGYDFKNDKIGKLTLKW